MLAGLNALGESLGITQVAPATFEFALQDFMACEGSFDAFRSARQTASTVVQTAMTALDDWLKVTRNVLAGRFGNRWSPLWAQAGFINHTTSIPGRVDDRLRVAFSLGTFFSAHPTYEVPGMLVTGARAVTLRNAALAAVGALATLEVNMQGQWVTRGASRVALTGLMRSLIKILGATIGKDDPRWLAFGLNLPGARVTPGQPQEVTVGVDAASGRIVLGCAGLALAERYRWRVRVAGSGLSYELAGSSAGPLVSIAPVAAGTVLEIVVQGVNGGAQGVASVPVLFTMPLEVAVPEVARKSERKSAPAGYGHAEGNGNGNGALARAV